MMDISERIRFQGLDKLEVYIKGDSVQDSQNNLEACLRSFVHQFKENSGSYDYNSVKIAGRWFIITYVPFKVANYENGWMFSLREDIQYSRQFNAFSFLKGKNGSISTRSKLSIYGQMWAFFSGNHNAIFDFFSSIEAHLGFVKSYDICCDFPVTTNDIKTLVPSRAEIGLRSEHIGGGVETYYLSSQSADVQVRMYDKVSEVKARKKAWLYPDLSGHWTRVETYSSASEKYLVLDDLKDSSVLLKAYISEASKVVDLSPFNLMPLFKNPFPMHTKPKRKNGNVDYAYYTPHFRQQVEGMIRGVYQNCGVSGLRELLKEAGLKDLSLLAINSKKSLLQIADDVF